MRSQLFSGVRMNKEETKAIVQILKNVYRDKFDITQGTFEIWCECMNDLRFDVTKKAATEYIKRSQYPPTVADIRNEYKTLWNEYLAMIKHIEESFNLASGCYPDVTEEQRATGKKAFIEIVNRYPREQKERVANGLSQKIIGYVREVESGTHNWIMPFDEYMEQMKHEFDR